MPAEVLLETLIEKWLVYIIVTLGVGFVFRDFWFGLVLTFWGLALRPCDQRPVRVDLRIPFIPIDVVLISRASQIRTAIADEGVGRLHAITTPELPYWVGFVSRLTRFFATRGPDGSWFLPFESGETNEYKRRKGGHIDVLGTLEAPKGEDYVVDDVQRVIQLPSRLAPLPYTLGCQEPSRIIKIDP
jgi:hypothetical protein